MFEEMACKTSLFLLITSSDAEAISVSVPDCAPGTPPDTGVSISLIPVSLINWPISSASEGLIVAERITVLPFTIFFARPSSSKMIDFA